MTRSFHPHFFRKIQRRSIAFFLLVVGFSLVAEAKPKKPREPLEVVEINATILYTRTGTLAIRKEGTFIYSLQANMVQKMVRVPSETGGRPAYHLLGDDHKIEGAVSGLIKLDGHAKVVDEATGKTLTLDARLEAVIESFDDIYIESIGPAEPLSREMMAEIRVHKKLKGSVNSNFPRMPDVAEADNVLLFPCGVANHPEEGLLSEGSIFVRPALGTKPKDPMAAQVWDLTSATYGLEDLPGLGGLRPPSFPAVTEGGGDHWVTNLEIKKDFVAMEGGGVYTDTIKVHLQPVAKLIEKE